MLSVTDAVKVAASSLVELFPKAENVRVEEVELSDDDQFWLITLGFIDPDVDPLRKAAELFPSLRDTRPRVYKVIKLNKETGVVRSIRMRERTDV